MFTQDLEHPGHIAPLSHTLPDQKHSCTAESIGSTRKHQGELVASSNTKLSNLPQSTTTALSSHPAGSCIQVS